MELEFDKAGQKLTVLSFGAGQDSTAILVRIIHDERFRKNYVVGQLIVIFADTKNEHQHTYAYVDYIKLLCKFYEILFFKVNPSEYATGKWKGGLLGFYEKNKSVGSKAFPKTCTDNLKIKPIYKFLEEYIHEKFQTQSYGRKKAFYEYFYKYGQIRVLIGIAAGEEKRASDEPTGIKWFDKCVEKVYPLIEQKMDREACQYVIKNEGYIVPMPSNCILCPFMSYQELIYLYRYENEFYNEWVKLEKQKIDNNLHKGDKNLGVWGTRKLLPEILEIAMDKFGHWDKERLVEYKMSHGHCVQSRY
jgi:hypothetical protein